MSIEAQSPVATCYRNQREKVEKQLTYLLFHLLSNGLIASGF